MSAGESSSSVSSAAGPSSSNVRLVSPPLPPEAIQKDDYAAAEQARQRFNKRGLFSSVSLPRLPRRNKSKSRKQVRSSPPSSIAELDRSTAVPQDGLDLVDLSEDPNLSELNEICDKDVYRWAIMYENQRGATMFSTPYYSPLTLLPLDPPPFTIPTATRSPRRNQPTVSLEDYPLPDGSWTWVSRAWLIDMRGDGQVQYDGFEYSRSFRSKKWGPHPGPLSFRGLVRRRRWIRLMMRPAQVHHDADSTISTPAEFSTLPEFEHNEEGATRPPSVMLIISDNSDEGLDVWQGDAKDWDRCHATLRRLGRDGKKLELWAMWLGVPETLPVSPLSSVSPITGPPIAAGQLEESSHTYQNGDAKSIVTGQTESKRLMVDTGVKVSKAPKEQIAAVIHAHGADIMNMFVYPDSRAKLLLLLGQVALLPELRGDIGLGLSDSVQILDFWSYSQDMRADVEPSKP